MFKLLILGGTQEAKILAESVSKFKELEVISSLAGRTNSPIIPVGMVRVGGFGGVEGLMDYLIINRIDLVIDATHPFATQISRQAIAATQKLNIAYLRLERPAWTRMPEDDWIEVESVAEAVTSIPEGIERIFLTIGRQQLAPFAILSNHWFLMRMIDPPSVNQSIPQGLLLFDRGPFLVEDEQDLLIRYNIQLIVSKNSGGEATYGKVIAARQLNLPIIMIQRPVMPIVDVVNDVEEAINMIWNYVKKSGV